MPRCQIILQVTLPSTSAGTGSTGGTEVLKHAWVYWHEGGKRLLLRTDARGLVFSGETAADKTHWWDYNTLFTAEVGTKVDIYFSRGAKPIPDDRLKPDSIFSKQIVALPKPGTKDLGQKKTPVSANLPNALKAFPTAILTLPNIFLHITTPADLSFWPLLWELLPEPSDTDAATRATFPTPAYYTDGLAQGASLWRGNALNVTVWDPQEEPLFEGGAPHPTAAVRPRERGLRIAGTIDARATGVTVALLDANGKKIGLRDSFNATETVEQVKGKMGTVLGSTKSFEALILFAFSDRDILKRFTIAQDHFGPVQIFVQSEGMSPPILEVCSVHLCGFQIALVDDHQSNENGQSRGPILDEGDEKLVVDFVTSPQATTNLIKAQTRQRRMIPYLIRNHRRIVDPSNPPGPDNPVIPKPQMPLWMAEFQMVGVPLAQLKDLMKRRYFQAKGGFIDPFVPFTTKMELSWQLSLWWDGPDFNFPLPNPERFYNHFTQLEGGPIRQTIVWHIGSAGQFTDAKAKDLSLSQGVVPNAFANTSGTLVTPVPAPFPIENRRVPQVIASGLQRRWGRFPATALFDTVVIEFQPLLTRNGREIIRGGEGILELQNVLLDNTPLDGGLVPGDNDMVSPSPNDPLMRVPRFRVYGKNPPLPELLEAADFAVTRQFNLTRTQAHVRFLHVNGWREALRRIVIHESGQKQFWDRTDIQSRIDRNGVAPPFFGRERGLPVFGQPHGYGLGQLDTPRPTDDQVWNFVDNLQGMASLLMGGKARDAFSALTSGAGGVAFRALGRHQQRAMLQRETVRRYASGIEFQFENGAWHVHTTTTTVPFLFNPNEVLGTRVPYNITTIERPDGTRVRVSDGRATFADGTSQFPNNPAFFGPGTDLEPEP